MRLRLQIWIVLGGLVLLGLTSTFAVREHLRSERASQHLAALERERLTFQQEVAKLETQQRKASDPAAVPLIAGSAAPLPPAATEEPPLTPESMAALRIESGRAEARSSYAPFFSQRGFSAAKIAAFLDRLSRHNEQMNTIASEWPDNIKSDPTGTNPVLQNLRARQKEEQSRYLTEMESWLGTDDFARFQQFDKESGFWSTVGDFAGRLHDTDTPLTPTQASQLAGVLVAQATDATGRIGRSAANWEQVFTQSAGFLSPPQLELLKTQHDYDETWRQMNLMSSRALDAAKAAANEKK